MPLHIDRLDLTLPASLGHRRHAIKRLLRSELGRHAWPGEPSLARLQVPDLRLSPQQSNRAIAAAIAGAIHRASWQRVTEGGRGARP